MRTLFKHMYVVTSMTLLACSANESGVVVNKNEVVGEVALANQSNEVRVEASSGQGQSKFNFDDINGSKYIRVWVNEENDAGGSFSKFTQTTNRNVGYINPETLDVTWYFETNDQNITNVKEIYLLLADGERVWKGTIFSVASKDTNADGLLNDDDMKDIYYAKDEALGLLFEDADKLEKVSTDQNFSVLLIRKESDLFAIQLTLDGSLVSFSKKVEAP